VDVHGHLTDQQAQRTGMAQGPTMSPTYFNISMSPLLEELDDGTIGIQIGDRKILGAAWSDDLILLTTEDKLQHTLDKVHTAMRKYKKMTNKDKVYIVPMWKYRDTKKKNQDEEQKEQEPQPRKVQGTKGHDIIHNHNYKLGEEKIKMLRRELFLGFYLNHNTAADKEQMKRANIRGNAAESKIKTLHMYHGDDTKKEAVKGLCKATVHTTVSANLTLHQMTTEQGQQAYDQPRGIQAKPAKNMLGTSKRVSPQTHGTGMDANRCTNHRSKAETLRAAKNATHRIIPETNSHGKNETGATRMYQGTML
jgi:hypothetical protein